jgi:large subunit ribosomal protein L18
MKTNIKAIQRARRQKRIRAKVSGTAAMPRLAVFKSNKFISAQLIDDDAGVTIASFSSMELKGKKTDQSKEVGVKLAAAAKAKGVTKVVFDRGGYIYTGRVQALAEGAREGGLQF